MTVREKILVEVKYETIYTGNTGGQTVGIPVSKVKLISEETGFEVIVSYERSQIKNKELALKLFTNYLDLLKI